MTISEFQILIVESIAIASLMGITLGLLIAFFRKK